MAEAFLLKKVIYLLFRASKKRGSKKKSPGERGKTDEKRPNRPPDGRNHISKELEEYLIRNRRVLLLGPIPMYCSAANCGVSEVAERWQGDMGRSRRGGQTKAP
jgi:hypothetical protein